ncbi:MAG: DUF3987 domain-containing protein [Acidobacteria bacterium]|nr:DUF3987 domain-containing protein [Acidobacteriota bacterium]
MNSSPPTEFIFQSIITKTKARQKGNNWMAHCPSHEDRQASLSIARGNDGTILLNCFAGCSTENIVEKLGIEMAELFPKKPQKQKRKIVATYDYRDEQGKLIFQCVRYEPKDFRQRRPDGKGGWIWNLNDTRRVLYRLPELLAADHSATVFICEGEADVDRLRASGLISTTSAMGAGAETNNFNWREEYNEPLAGHPVVVLPDNDQPGYGHANAVAQSVQAVASSVKILPLPGVPKHGDVRDWLHMGGTIETLIAMAESAPVWTPGAVSYESDAQECESDEWEAPAPFFYFDLPEFPLDALPSWQRAFVDSLASSTQTPIDLAALMSLAVCSAAVARNVRVEARDGWEEPLNLFVTVALPPANRKSQVMADVTKPLYEYEREMILSSHERIAEEKSEYSILVQELADLEKKCAKADVVDRDKLREETKAKARELAARKVPTAPKLIVDDVTSEVLATILSEQGGRVALFSAEGGIFETLAGRYANGTPNIDIFLKGHSGDDLRVDRRDRSEHIVHPALTIGLAVQPDVLRGMIEKPGFRGRGLIGRFLYSLPQSTIGNRKIRPGAMSTETRRTYHHNVYRLASIEPYTNDAGETEPRLIRFSKDADDYLAAFEEEIEPMLGIDGELAFIGDWGGKLAGATVRIAGIMHLAMHAESISHKWPVEIEADTLKRAITIARYLLTHARMAYAEMGADQKIEDAKIVLRWIEKTDSREFTKRDVYQGTKSRFKQVSALEPALKVLEDHGYIQTLEILIEKRPGRYPSERFVVNPLYVSDYQKNGVLSCADATHVPKK